MSLIDAIEAVRRECQVRSIYCVRDYPSCAMSSWQIGGPVSLMIEAQSKAELSAIVELVVSHAVPFVVVGDATNLLFLDEGILGVVVRVGRRLQTWRVDGTHLSAGAGMWVPRLARLASQLGLAGIEHVVGIPGTLGGLIVMNGGSLRRSIGENLKTVTAIHRATGRNVVIDNSDCEFGYRTSVFQKGEWIVTGATLQLARGNSRKIRKEMLQILRARSKKFPRKLPQCGSVFKSHPELYRRHGSPGAILDSLGLKGTRRGDAEISTLHANFVVNLGCAKSKDVLELVHLARQRVVSATGFSLATEAHVVTPDCLVIPIHEYIDNNEGKCKG